MPEPALILASASPRRRVLLAMLGVDVEVRPAGVDEAALGHGLEAIEAAQRIARAKAAAIEDPDRPVLAADTVVALDDAVLGKPTDRSDAADMLRRQSGNAVQVVSCVALRLRSGDIDDRLAIATMRVADLAETTIAAYLDTGEADDKAGALAVQGAAGAFVTVVDGARSTVVGLPLSETIELLTNAGIAVQDPRTAGL